MAESNEPTNPPEPPKPEPPAPEPPAKPEPQTPEPPKGQPDATNAAQRYKEERDKVKADYEALQKRITELEGDSKTVKELQTELEAEKAARAKEATELEAKRLNTVRLTQAGCIDPDVALGLLNDLGDVDKLKKEKPYLFEAAKPKGSTGLKPDGASDSGLDAKIDAAFAPRK